jgi:hypothetical protein
MAEITAGERTLRLERVDAWENEDGVFIASDDPGCEFITELTGAAKKAVHAALAAAGRKTG